MSAAAANPFTFDERTHCFRVNGQIVPSVTQALEAAGICVDPESLHPAARRNFERKGEIGTEVHRACWYLDENDLDLNSLTEEVAPYVMAYCKFKEERPDYSPIRIEQATTTTWEGMYFGGVIDRIANLEGRACVVDLKTGNKPQDGWPIQTAAYELLWGGCNGAFGRMVLHLKPDATYKLIPYTSPHDHEVFVAALRIAWWKLGKK